MLDANKTDGGLSVSATTVILTMIFFNWTKALGAEMTAILDLLSHLARSSRAKISAVSCEYFQSLVMNARLWEGLEASKPKIENHSSFP